MANSYQTWTLMDDIPAHLIPNTHKTLITEIFGFRTESAPTRPDAGEAITTYIYGMSEEGNFDLDSDMLAEQIADRIEPGMINLEEIHSDVLRERLKAVLDPEANAAGGDNISVADILGDIVDKHPTELPEIVIMSGYYCSKPRPGEFGGTVCRITPGRIQWRGTHQLIDELRVEDQRVLDIAALLDAQGAGKAPPAEAVARLHDYVVNHPAIKDDSPEAAPAPSATKEPTP